MFPEWNDELEKKLREIYHNSKPSEDTPSKHTGLQAVYSYLVTNNPLLQEAVEILKEGQDLVSNDQFLDHWAADVDSFLIKIRTIKVNFVTES